MSACDELLYERSPLLGPDEDEGMKVPREMLDPRRAGRVTRFHSEVVVQRQTDAEHQWNCARILLAILPTASRALLVEALFHDMGEGFAGDSPSPAKGAHPPLRAALHEAEGAARLAMALPWGVPARAVLTSGEAEVLDLVDNLEAWEHLLYERALGNRFAEVMLGRCDLSIKTRMLDAAPEVRLRAEAYMDRRLAEEAAR